MFNTIEFERKQAELKRLLENKFGVSSGDLISRMRKVGRRAPKRAHVAARVISEAHVHAGHPKLRRFIDEAAVDHAFITLRGYLKSVDVADRRKGMVLDVLGALSFNLMLAMALLMAFLRWRGWV
ncbi:MAG: hypothetical protein R3256_08265 [Thalassovita sp.]|nr:hypothetical protein [Thalassovita sp.]